VEIGPRDIKDNAVFVARRDEAPHIKTSVSRNDFVQNISHILDSIQSALYQKALAYREEHTRIIDDQKEFDAYFTPRNMQNPELHGGFALSCWCGSEMCEQKIKAKHSVTIRCVPFDGVDENGKCICCGAPARRRVVFAKAY
jgi:prolyl-tRNA synthetase